MRVIFCALLLLAACLPLVAVQARTPPAPRDIAQLEQALVAQPEDLETLQTLAAALLAEVRITPRADTLARAEQLIDRLLARHAPRADALDAWRLLINHRFDAALVAARRAEAANGDDLLALCSVADALTELGRYAEAEAAVQTLLDRHYGIAALARASHLRRLFGDLPGAIELTQRALNLPSTKADRAWLLLDLAELELAAGAGADSLTLATAAVGALPAPALTLQARAWQALGNPRAALALYRVVTAHTPRVEALVEQLRLARALGETALAARTAQLLTAMARLDAQSGGADGRGLVEFHLLEDDLPAAEQLARAEWRRRPDVYSAAQLAWVLLRAGRTLEARAYAERAIAEHSADPLLEWRAGTVLVAAGDDKGRDLIREALDAQPWLATQDARLAAQP